MSRLVGINAVRDLVGVAPHAITRILVTDQAGAVEHQLAERLRTEGVPVERVSSAALQDRAGGRGGASIAAEIATARSRGTEAYVASPGEQRILLALDQVTDPHNLGAILRTAAAFGVEAVIVPRNHSAPLTDAAIRASAGGAALIPVERVTNLARTIRDLEGQGFWSCAVTGASETTLWSRDYQRMSWLFVLGAEGKGIRPAVERACGLGVRIEGGGSLSTLNVSVATAIVVAEARRQHALNP